MDRKQLTQALNVLSPLGDTLKARSMFGGFGLFVDDVMFAVLVDNGIALRSNTALLPSYLSLGMVPYCYQKKGFPVTTSYYLVPKATCEDIDHVLSLARESLQHAKHDKLASVQKKKRLKDLPNMRLATERMLKKAGIVSVEQLQNVGASGAYNAIRISHDVEPKTQLLWALEGAIKGMHWSLVSQERRKQLLERVSGSLTSA